MPKSAISPGAAKPIRTESGYLKSCFSKLASIPSWVAIPVSSPASPQCLRSRTLPSRPFLPNGRALDTTAARATSTAPPGSSPKSPGRALPIR